MKKQAKQSLSGAIIILLAMVGKLFVDLRFWKKGVVIKHTKEWFIVAPLYAIGVYLMTKGLLTHNDHILLSWYGLLYSFVSGMAAAFTVWLLFDGIFQIARGLNFFGTGSEDGKDDAKTDDFLQSKPKWVQITIKVGFTILFIVWYIILLN